MSHDDLASTSDVTDLQCQLEARAGEHTVLGHRVQPATQQCDVVNDTGGGQYCAAIAQIPFGNTWERGGMGLAGTREHTVFGHRVQPETLHCQRHAAKTPV